MKVKTQHAISEGETYFKRGARIKPAIRLRLTEAMVAQAPERPQAGAYALAKANLHKPWARRWLRSKGYFL